MKNLIIILFVLIGNGIFAQNTNEDEKAKLLSEEKKLDVETGRIIANYDLFPSIIKTNRALKNTSKLKILWNGKKSIAIISMER